MFSVLRIKIEIEWSVNFLFKASDQTSGQINIDVEFPAKLCTVKSSTKNEEGLMIGGYDMSAAESNITNTFTAQLEKCKPYFEDVKKALSESKFVLSGSGYFNFTNPIFTRNGDLLVNIKYQAYVLALTDALLNHVLTFVQQNQGRRRPLQVAESIGCGVTVYCQA